MLRSLSSQNLQHRLTQPANDAAHDGPNGRGDEEDVVGGDEAVLTVPLSGGEGGGSRGDGAAGLGCCGGD